MSVVALTGKCPECGSMLSVRRRRNDGQPFIGCNGYPDCRFIASYDEALQSLKRLYESTTDARAQERVAALEADLATARQHFRDAEAEVHRLRSELAVAKAGQPRQRNRVIDLDVFWVKYELLKIAELVHPDKVPNGVSDTTPIMQRIAAMLDALKRSA